jgi:glycosyltransferase involved in cell wall biosynthesis
VFALIMIVLVIYWRILRQPGPLVGFTIITAAIFFFGAVQLLCLGILGEYLGRVYEEVKGRPIYTIKEVAGFKARKSLQHDREPLTAIESEQNEKEVVFFDPRSKHQKDVS